MLGENPQNAMGSLSEQVKAVASMALGMKRNTFPNLSVHTVGADLARLCTWLKDPQSRNTQTPKSWQEIQLSSDARTGLEMLRHIVTAPGVKDYLQERSNYWTLSSVLNNETSLSPWSWTDKQTEEVVNTLRIMCSSFQNGRGPGFRGAHGALYTHLRDKGLNLTSRPHLYIASKLGAALCHFSQHPGHGQTAIARLETCPAALLDAMRIETEKLRRHSNEETPNEGKPEAVNSSVWIEPALSGTNLQQQDLTPPPSTSEGLTTLNTDAGIPAGCNYNDPHYYDYSKQTVQPMALLDSTLSVQAYLPQTQTDTTMEQTVHPPDSFCNSCTDEGSAHHNIGFPRDLVPDWDVNQSRADSYRIQDQNDGPYYLN